MVQCYLQGSRSGKLLTQNSQDTALFHQNSVKRFGCAMRGFKISLPLTLTSMEVDHAGVNVCFCRADGPHQQWKVLVDHGDGQGLPVQCPPPYADNKHDRVDQPTLFKGQELVDRIMDLDVGNLYDRKWRCKFLQMVLQYRQLCLSRRIAKSVHFVFKFCLYIVHCV